MAASPGSCAGTSPRPASAIPPRAASRALEILAGWPGLHALLAHRVAHALRRRGRARSCRARSPTFSRALTGIEIHPAAAIGDGLFIDHGIGVVIGETAEIGANVTLYQGVTLGGTGFATGKRHPTVQDNVTIGSGAKLLGPITIGHGAKIGANAVVIHDVPPNSTVVGNPGHPVRIEGRRPEGPDADWVHLPGPDRRRAEGDVDADRRRSSASSPSCAASPRSRAPTWCRCGPAWAEPRRGIARAPGRPLAAVLVLAIAAPAQADAPHVRDRAQPLAGDRVYVHPTRRTLSAAQADELRQRITAKREGRYTSRSCGPPRRCSSAARSTTRSWVSSSARENEHLRARRRADVPGGEHRAEVGRDGSRRHAALNAHSGDIAATSTLHRRIGDVRAGRSPDSGGGVPARPVRDPDPGGGRIGLLVSSRIAGSASSSSAASRRCAPRARGRRRARRRDPRARPRRAMPDVTEAARTDYEEALGAYERASSAVDRARTARPRAGRRRGRAGPLRDGLRAGAARGREPPERTPVVLLRPAPRLVGARRRVVAALTAPRAMVPACEADAERVERGRGPRVGGRCTARRPPDAVLHAGAAYAPSWAASTRRPAARVCSSARAGGALGRLLVGDVFGDYGGRAGRLRRRDFGGACVFVGGGDFGGGDFEAPRRGLASRAMARTDRSIDVAKPPRRSSRGSSTPTRCRSGRAASSATSVLDGGALRRVDVPGDLAVSGQTLDAVRAVTAYEPPGRAESRTEIRGIDVISTTSSRRTAAGSRLTQRLEARASRSRGEC